MGKVLIPSADLNHPEKLRQYEEVINQALLETPENPNLYIVKAVLALDDKDYVSALYYARTGIGFNPSQAGYYVTLSSIYDRMGDREQAYDVLKQAYKISQTTPAVNWNLALAHLMAGKFEEGWDLYRWRRVHLPNHIRTLQPVWEPLIGKKYTGQTLLVWCEQGMGDIVMMFRFLSRIKERFGFEKVILECGEEMFTLFSRHTANVDQVYIGSPDHHFPFKFDQHCCIMDLPYCFRVRSTEDWRGDQAYIYENKAVREQWEKNFIENNVNGKRIGICWAGSPKHPDDKNRSASLKDFHPLDKCGNLFALQKESDDSERFVKPEEMTLYNISSGLINADYLTGIIGSMDVVVAIDSFVAHMAGAMGKKTIVLLPYLQEWRWMTGEGRSYLYNNVHMVKQKEPGDWAGSIKRACEIIKET